MKPDDEDDDGMTSGYDGRRFIRMRSDDRGASGALLSPPLAFLVVSVFPFVCVCECVDG